MIQKISKVSILKVLFTVGYKRPFVAPAKLSVIVKEYHTVGRKNMNIYNLQPR